MNHATPERFPCYQCGACCMNISDAPEIGEWATATGACRYYDPDKCQCQIYDRRPTVCNVWKTYRQQYENRDVSWDDFVYTNMLNCCLLRYLNEIPEPEESPFYGMQEEIAAQVLYDLEHPAEAIKRKHERDELDEDMDEQEGAFNADASEESPSDSTLVPTPASTAVATTTPKSKKHSNSNNNNRNGNGNKTREKLDRAAYEKAKLEEKIAASRKPEKPAMPDVPLEDQTIDLGVPDIGNLNAKGKKAPKSSSAAAKKSRHRGELL